jgi:hypothetical protein
MNRTSVQANPRPFAIALLFSELSFRHTLPVAYSPPHMEHVVIEPATLENLPQLTHLFAALK